ncbi:hypothetical protein DL93DRAFT_2153037 [Clavulina sp. PMI_390]|nr:hypothetical protein DL93DRAFT_2153037 [Clavulina sp. PMI_390]
MLSHRYSMVSIVLRGSFAILTLALHALAAPATGMVVTPVGLRSAEHVHEVPAGGSIKHSGDVIQLLDADGNVLHTSTDNSAAPISKRFETGWTAYTGWSNSDANSPINSFTTSWTVPPAPQTNNGQTIFLFNSIEPAQGNAILQPVLQWGGSAAGGGAYWAVASWYLGPSEYRNVAKIHNDIQIESEAKEPGPRSDLC